MNFYDNIPNFNPQFQGIPNQMLNPQIQQNNLNNKLSNLVRHVYSNKYAPSLLQNAQI